jgi:hypothetical protein
MLNQGFWVVKQLWTGGEEDGERETFTSTWASWAFRDLTLTPI